VYVADAGWDAHVWVGSANATVHGFEKNVEFLVELQGKKSRCGIDAILGNQDNKGSLIRILREQQLPDSDDTDKDLELRQLEKRLEAIRKRISAADFAVHVEREGDLFRLQLCLPNLLESIPLDAVLKCWPLSMRQDTGSTYLPYGQHASLHKPGDSISFGPVDATAITSFIAFEVSLPYGVKMESVSFLCNFPLIGAPEDRMDLLLRGMLKNRDDLLRYLIMLLADGGFENMNIDVLLNEEARSGAASTERQTASAFPLFEALMKTLQRNPAQLDSIAEIIESLRKTDEGLSMLPDGFMDLWEPIWQVRKGMIVC
jgi:hypothetical protein